ncbi:MAG: class I SAM-dependent methyltransferase [Gaiellaceae bacterium]
MGSRVLDKSRSILKAQYELLHPAGQGLRINAYDRSFNRTCRIPEMAIEAISDVRLPPLEVGVDETTVFYALAAITRRVAPLQVFEFGTYRGHSTTTFALNSDARIFTLDLPDGEVVAANAQDMQLMQTRGLGHLPDSVQRLYGDSRAFDFAPYENSIDLVYVDGGHDADVVVSDTRNAFNMVRAGGTIVWDDYGWMYPGLVGVLDELAANYREMRRIRGTRLVILG